MSSQGALVDVSGPLAENALLEVSIDWTGLYHDRPMMRLFLIARVERIDHRGTALRFISHQFVEPSPESLRPRRRESALAVA